MGFELAAQREYWSQNWRFDNCLGLSKLAVLFPNELRQDGGQLNSIVKIPVISEVKLQTTWSQEIGFIENNAEERVVQMMLEENFTSYTKIDRVNIPGPQWAANKMKIIERQEAARYDEFVLQKICTGVTKKLAYENITKDNFIEIFKKIEKEAKKNKWLLSNGLLLISPKIATIIANSKLSQTSYSLENTSITVNTILNKYNCVETDVDDYGYDIIAVLPSCFVWASYTHTPLQSGEYESGKFYGQRFTVLNKFFNGEIIEDTKILGFKNSSEEFRLNDESDENNLDNYKQNTINEMEKFADKAKYSNFFEPYKRDILNSKNIDSINMIFDKFVSKIE